MKCINWESKLIDYIQSMEDKPFVWGVSDCCHFSAEWARIATGFNVGELYPCNTAKEALKMMNKNGGVKGIADNHFDRIDINYAKRGDVVETLVDGKNSGLGICMGALSVFKSDDGLLKIDTIKCSTAWSIN